LCITWKFEKDLREGERGRAGRAEWRERGGGEVGPRERENDFSFSIYKILRGNSREEFGKGSNGIWDDFRKDSERGIIRWN
jgi:hypothetical protein